MVAEASIPHGDRCSSCSDLSSHHCSPECNSSVAQKHAARLNARFACNDSPLHGVIIWQALNQSSVECEFLGLVALWRKDLPFPPREIPRVALRPGMLPNFSSTALKAVDGATGADVKR